jgi:predicted AlkP superfamily pyrophosphatase or phosphodiesterase
MKARLPVFILLVAAVSLFLASCIAPQPAAGAPAAVILISIDGFRWDYLEKYDAPVLQQLAAEGVRAERMNPSFPSKTFPNHYTLVTGLRPEHHGIVGNWFWDPALGEMFNMQKTEEKWWAGGEPVWITAQKQGVRSACYFWPGSETAHGGMLPGLYRPFDGKMPSAARVDGLLAWLDLPAEQRPRLVTLYFDIVDHIGHTYGPDAPETRAAVKEADDALGRLLAGLTARGLRDKYNLVIVSDHGMSACGPEQVVFLDDLMDLKSVQVEQTGPTGGVRPKPGTVSAAQLAANIRAQAPPQVKVYLRADVPARLHFRASNRISPVVLICDDHWNLETKAGWPKRILTYPRGNHGWDPATSNMGALFVASGPAFRRGATIPAFDNIHVYHLLCTVLGVQPAPNDGDDRLARAGLRR